MAMTTSSPNTISDPWPVLTRYEGASLLRVALPLGGIGTGTISLGGRGDLRDFEMMNRPAKGYTPNNAFFALWCKEESGEAVTRCLEGPIDASLIDGFNGSIAKNHSLPRFRHCRFEAAYPLGQLFLSDPDVPLNLRLEAFNPLIPTDADRSGIPLAVLCWVLTNPTDTPIEAAICLSLPNFIGNDGVTRQAKANTNAYRQQDNLSGIFLSPGPEIPTNSDTWGSMAVSTLSEGDGLMSYRTAWAKLSWGDSLLDFWDDFSEDGALSDRDSEGVDQPVASLAVKITIAPGESRGIPFFLTWRFPNRHAWGGGEPPIMLENHYATQYSDAWDVIAKVRPDLEALEKETVAFVRVFVGSDLPDVVKEAALYNASTLRTQTCFRTEGGRLFGWEGCNDNQGCCHGSCTHVWNYEVTTPYLFGKLSRSLREVEFGFSTTERGRISFRTGLPLAGKALEWKLAAADGQMGCLMKLYRDWKLGGDEAFLKRLWPRARKALEFCWIPGGWDADRDGVMEGCQHNTMDVEYYGPNPQMGTWYLGALRACEEMAKHLGEANFATECRRLFESGSAYLDSTLFNGEYYEHHIIPPVGESAIDAELRHESMGAKNLAEPELQLGAGCLIDQLVGQYMAHICGLGYLLKPLHIRKTLQSLMRYNFKDNLWGHFNHMRTFALQEEAAMLMAAYPKGGRPKRPFPYCNEVMTGFEYTAAAHLLYEEMNEDGLRVIHAIRNRHDGRHRNPFNEPECGHHYARAMAAWASVLALTGFQYDGTAQRISFAHVKNPTTWFWSTGDAWGTVRLSPQPQAIAAELTVHGGNLPLRSVVVGLYGMDIEPTVLHTGDTVDVLI